MSWTTRVIPLLVAATSICFLSAAAASNSTSSHSHPGHHLLTRLSQWREHYLSDASSHAGGAGGVRRHTVLAWVLAFLAASVSSAGGVGGGSLFLPILNLVAGLTLKRATTYSSFMVTGGAASNVLYNLWRARGRPALIDYDIALLFQPCLLLGVSIGVVCNVMFPEWLITALFSLFLAFCTAKTCRAGAKIWRPLELPLQQCRPWTRSIDHRKASAPGVISIKPCGVAYWLATVSQVPFAVAFTAYIIYAKRKKQAAHRHEDGKANSSVHTKTESLPALALPLAAFVTGSLSGLFGIGGGLLLNPVLLQIGIPPQTAAATSSFMVLFCASMSMVQFILLGMDGIGEASVYAGICFFASIAGVVLIERVVRKSGRVSMIVFLVTAIMALSTVIVTCFGALDVWTQYTGGAYMGFKLPC
uniref:Uncharacterized protein n=1 Tax=Aegilops tauschii TaxID=37682 RepID=M8BHW6_AEGTA